MAEEGTWKMRPNRALILDCIRALLNWVPQLYNYPDIDLQVIEIDWRAHLLT